MKTRPKFFLQLGRAGDILNVLPLLRRDAEEHGEPCPIMVGRAYERLFEGVTYAVPIFYEGKFEDVARASIEAGKLAAVLGRELICTQIYGDKFWVPLTCWSFMRQSWAQCPDAPAWGTLPLVFDNRDRQREADVIQQLRRGKPGPYVVCALSGTSSPFEHALEVLEGLRGAGVDVVDVSGFLCDRFQDLLGLLEGAHAIVAVDSGVLHLAHAVPEVPVVALITRDPSKWHGSAWRRQHKARFFYDEMPEMLEALIHCVQLARNAVGPRILHVYTHLEKGASADTVRRNNFAASTWVPEYQTARWVSLPFGETNLTRSSGDAPIDDERPIPFMHDVINTALQFHPEILSATDVIAWTNADSCFAPGLTGKMLEVVARHGCAFTHRWDFHTKLEKPFTHEGQIRRGEWYPGTDACFFTVQWWIEHRHEYPDMLVGREQNDEVLRQLIKRHGGLEIPAAIYHEKHPSFWEHHGRRMTGNGNLYNQRLARAWFRKMGFRPFDPVWWQLEPEDAQRQWALQHVQQWGPA
jgi:hypothetical protein